VNKQQIVTPDDARFVIRDATGWISRARFSNEHARDVAREYDTDFPENAPHRVYELRLCELQASMDLDAESHDGR
jgi:hypothetical protein